jgi:hypothetical protein
VSKDRPGAATLALRFLAAAAIVLLVSGVGEQATRRPLASATSPGDAKRIAFSGRQLPQTGTNTLSREVRSLLNLRKPMRYGEFVWDDKGVPDGPVWVRVDLTTQTLSIFRAGHEIGTAVVLYGAGNKPTPVGIFGILDKSEHHRSSLYDAAMPYTLRLTDDGISIHGSDVRPAAATHGCVGVPTQFAARLFEQVKVGDEVMVVREDTDPGTV